MKILNGRVDLARRLHPPVATGVVADAVERDPQEVRRELEVSRNLQVKARAVSRSLTHRGNDEALDVSAQIQNPTDTGAPIVLVEFEVPLGMVAVIDQIGIFYSEPIVPMTLAVGWRIAVNDNRIPYIVHSGGTEDYNFSSFGDVNDPMKIRELWVQANQRVAIQIRAFFGFNEALVMMGRLAGRLFKPANPNVASTGGL
jgi:hypothetical protein